MVFSLPSFDHGFDKRIFHLTDNIVEYNRFCASFRASRVENEGNVETSKWFFCFFFFLPRLAPKSSNCGLVNANDEKFRTGQSQVSGHDSLPSSLYIRNVLQQLFAFRFTVCDSALSLPKLPPKRESDSSYSKDIFFFSTLLLSFLLFRSILFYLIVLHEE